jgi:DMSO reductase anchor subunit
MPQLRNEWPLVLFTAIAPAGVGAGAVLSYRYYQLGIDPLIFPASLTILGTIVLAFIVSAAHLGRRERMPRALRNIFRSWLSREIFFMSGCCILFAACALMYFFKDRPEIKTRYISFSFVLASAAGVLGLLSMQRVYRLKSVLTWMGLRGFSMVFSTAAFLGTLEAVLILHVFDQKSIVDMLWRYLPMVIVPVFFDGLQVYALKSLGRKVLLTVFVILRLAVYLSAFHLLGYIDIVRLAVMMGLLFVSDVILRAAFFGEQTTSFQTEMAQARRLRLTSSGTGRTAASQGVRP